MPNSGGPRSSRRKLYAHVVDSILLYGAPVWSTAALKRAFMKQAESAHRRACLRVQSSRSFLISQVRITPLLSSNSATFQLTCFRDKCN
ncbi:unnamed protein product, partial [Trichogramma brassicae]